LEITHIKKKKKKKSKDASFVSGIVKQIGCLCPRSIPNYGNRSGAMVALIKSNELVSAFIPFDGGANYINEGDHVLLSHFRMTELPIVRYRVVKVENISLESRVHNKIIH